MQSLPSPTVSARHWMVVDSQKVFTRKYLCKSRNRSYTTSYNSLKYQQNIFEMKRIVSL